ncbi:MAG: helix-turn-helix domain-containing protein [Bacteroidota bacterium]
MKLQSFQPHISIADYVDSIVVLEDENLSDCVIPLIAKGLPSIAFQLTGSSNNNGNTHLVLYGQNRKPFEFYASGHLTIIAYFLRPHVLNNLFGLDAYEATDLAIDLSYTKPAKDSNLKEQLLNAASLNTRLLLLNNYVLDLAGCIHTGINKPVAHATEIIQKSKGLVSLKNIHDELNVTERTLQRMFEQHIGLSPKAFSKICQFNSAFLQVDSGAFSKLGDIAYQNGYADQSHLIRVFKEFTNISPKEYLKQSSEFKD